MTPHVTVCGHGREATQALADAIAAVKEDDLFAKVTVLVPSNLAGLSARRLLGSGALGGNGIANVDFVTPFRLSELLAPVRTPGRNPLTNPVLAAAVRRVLATEPGRFAAVAGHEATEAALIDVYDELSGTLAATRTRIADASTHGRSLIEVFDRIDAVLSGYEDEDDLVGMATARIEGDAGVAGIVGSLVWWLPEPVSPAVRALLRSMFSCVPAHVIVALTGADDADHLIGAVGAQLGLDVETSVLAGEPPIADRILSVSDADEEVRAVVREVLALAEQGVALHRIGIFHPRPDPYARSLHEQLDAACIAHTGPDRRRLADLTAGRVLLAGLDLDREGFSRASVMRLCATGPVRDDEGFVPQGRWERSSREIGVVAGLDDWRRKVESGADRLRDRIAEAGDTDERRIDRLRGDIVDLERMLAFVDRLAAGGQAIADAGTWAAKAAAATDLGRLLLGPDRSRLHWPDIERDAADRVEAALARLAVLDAVEPDPGDESFRRAVVAELDANVGRVGSYGRGLLYGPLSAAVGQDLDAVFVLGMAEGTCPSPRAEDPLLNDGLRGLAVDDELTSRSESLAAQHRSLLAAVAAAPAGTMVAPRRFMTFPRGDLRSNRDRIPSRWLLPTASRLAGRRVSTADFEMLEIDGLHVVPSFAAGLVDERPSTDLAEFEAAAVQRYVTDGGAASDHPYVTDVIARGLDAATSRVAGRFTEWDGNLEGAEIDLPGISRPASATRLQTWANCPFSYFLGHVLGLDDRDDPDTITSISALDRGSLLHAILEDFVAWAIAERVGGPPDPGETWNEADRIRMHEIASHHTADYEAKGRTGRPLAWEIEKGQLAGELDVWLGADARERTSNGTTPIAVEMAFGLDDKPPLELITPSGRSLTFRGYIDRVDEAADATIHVYDYKSSRQGKYKKLIDDPVDFGKTLQLGLYAEAVRAKYGAEREVDARFWLATAKGENERAGYRWTEDRRERFLDVTEAIVEGIEAGAFPATPGEFDMFWRRNENCTFCAFDSLCPKDRADHETATFTDERASRPVARLDLPQEAGTTDTGTESGHA